jgi:hypothetical protein
MDTPFPLIGSHRMVLAAKAAKGTDFSRFRHWGAFRGITCCGFEQQKQKR